MPMRCYGRSEAVLASRSSRADPDSATCSRHQTCAPRSSPPCMHRMRARARWRLSCWHVRPRSTRVRPSPRHSTTKHRRSGGGGGRDPQRQRRNGRGLEPDRAESCLGSLATGDVAARAASLEALRRLRRPLADAQLAACVADPSPEVRAAAMSALENTLQRKLPMPSWPGSATQRHASGPPPPRRSRAVPRSTLGWSTCSARPTPTTEAAAIAALAGRGEQAATGSGLGRRRGHARAGAQRGSRGPSFRRATGHAGLRLPVLRTRSSRAPRQNRWRSER